MKKLLSIILVIAMSFCFLPNVVGFGATITHSENAYCYIAANSTKTSVYNGFEFTADEYFSDSDAMSAAIETLTANALTHSYAIYLNKDMVFTSQFVAKATTQNSVLCINLNGYSMKYEPTSEIDSNTSCFIVEKPDFKSFTVTGASKADSAQTLVVPEGNDQPFFTSTTLSGDKFQICGTYAGYMTIPTCARMTGPTIYGNVGSATSIITAISMTVYGNVSAKKLSLGTSGTGSNTVIHGDLNLSGAIQMSANSLTVDGNTTVGSGNSYEKTYSINVTSASAVLTFHGDLILNQNKVKNNSGNIALPSAGFKGSITVDGKTISNYECKSNVLLNNYTFGKGFYATPDSIGIYTFDSTCEFGSVFYNEDIIFDSKIATYGEKVIVPSEPKKDDSTFLGWANENNEIVDLANEIQGANNCYYAKWAKYASAEITITEDGQTLPEANLLTNGLGKILCFKDELGNIVEAGSVGEIGKTYTAVTVDIEKLNGAQMRLNDVYGLRFLTSVERKQI